MTDIQPPEDSQIGLFEIDDKAIELLDEIADPELRHKWPETMASMFDVVASSFRHEGFEPDKAARLAGLAVRSISIYHGGRPVYLPKGLGGTFLRDREMFHLWMSGKATPDDLVNTHKLSYQRVMQVLDEQRKLWRKKHAPMLPGFDD